MSHFPRGLLLIPFLIAGCSSVEPSDQKDRGGVIDQAAAQDGTAAGDASLAANEAAFAATLHPIVREHCGACHGASQSPKFAVDDHAAAFKVITEAQLVNPPAVPASRLVTRLGQFSHNCWSECAADAKTMEDAIRAYLAQGGGSGRGDPAALIKLGVVKASAAKEIELKGGYGGNWVVAAAKPKALGERLMAKEDLTASQRSVLSRIETINQQDQEQGGAYYFFDIPEAPAKYQVWFRAKNTGEGSRVLLHINGKDMGDAAPYRQQDNQAITQKYTWIPAFVAKPEGKNADEPTSRELKRMAGLNELMLYIPDTEADVDMIALTANPTIDQSLSVNTGKVNGFSFDLTGLLGKKATLTLQYAETLDGKAYVFSRPSIEVDDPALKVKVKTMYVILNGDLNKQLSTFASVDTTLTGPGELNHGDLIVPVVDKATDTIELAFGELVVVP